MPSKLISFMHLCQEIKIIFASLHGASGSFSQEKICGRFFQAYPIHSSERGLSYQNSTFSLSAGCGMWLLAPHTWGDRFSSLRSPRAETQTTSFFLDFCLAYLQMCPSSGVPDITALRGGARRGQSSCSQVLCASSFLVTAPASASSNSSAWPQPSCLLECTVTHCCGGPRRSSVLLANGQLCDALQEILKNII